MSYNTLLLITRLGLYQTALQLWGSKPTAGASILAAAAIAFDSASFSGFLQLVLCASSTFSLPLGCFTRPVSSFSVSKARLLQKNGAFSL
jgi:hypothetical protein